jgi:hypothetical protein
MTESCLDALTLYFENTTQQCLFTAVFGTGIPAAL